MSASNSSPRRTRSRYPSIYYRDTPDGRAYEVTFRDHAGRQRWERVEGTDNIEEARDLLATRQGKKRKGEKTPPAGAKFGEVRQRYQQSKRFRNYAGTTRQTYLDALEKVIGPRFDRQKIAAVNNTQVLASFIGELENRLTPQGRKPRKSTTENILKPMRGVMRQAAKEGLISVSAFALLDRDDRPAEDEDPHEWYRWSDAKLAALFAASEALAAKETSRYDYSPMLKLAAKAGPRLGECLGLDWPDCHLVKGEGFIRIERQWTRLKELKPPKWGSRRKVGIADDVVVMLLELKLKMEGVNEEGPVFASRNGGRLSYRNVERRGFDRAAAEAGLEGCTFHDLRHAFGSKLADRGLTTRQIADAMGHKKASTAEIYVQTFNEDQADDRIRKAMTG